MQNATQSKEEVKRDQKNSILWWGYYFKKEDDIMVWVGKITLSILTLGILPLVIHIKGKRNAR